MTKYLLPLASFATALGVAATSALTVHADKPADPPKPAEVKPADAAPAKAEAAPAKLAYAIEPRPLTESAKKGLTYLAETQQADGGWGQGGGWRSGGQGRVEGKDVADPSDMGNTCIALLAFVRSGNTATEGEYKDVVRKGLAFVVAGIEKSDGKDLYVTDVRNTQLQSKIGPYVDTFLAALVLSESKGKAGADEKKLIAAHAKIVDKMAKNQQADGTFAGNGGWAPVLSQGIANKALARGRLNGFEVKDEVFARATRQSVDAAKGQALAAAGPGDAAGAPGLGGLPSGTAARGGARSAGGVAGGASRGDAGVALYSAGQGAGNLQDVVNSVNVDAEKAKKVVADPKSKPEDKAAAEKTVKEAEELNRSNATAQRQLGGQIRDRAFVNGFGSNGGEEFLSFLNIAEALVVKGGKDWADWDKQMQDMIPKAQDKDGSWSGHHCITGKTFCTAGALLVMLADRTQFPEDVIKTAREDAKKAEAAAAKAAEDEAKKKAAEDEAKKKAQIEKEKADK